MLSLDGVKRSFMHSIGAFDFLLQTTLSGVMLYTLIAMQRANAVYAATPVVVVLYAIWCVHLVVRRCATVGISPWWTLLALVPVLNLVFYVFLLLSDDVGGAT